MEIDDDDDDESLFVDRSIRPVMGNFWALFVNTDHYLLTHLAYQGPNPTLRVGLEYANAF